MRIVSISGETKKTLDLLNKHYNDFSEMTSSEQSFLCELIQQKQPKKLLELGVAAGSSSVIILNSIKDIQGSHLTSVDYLTLWYRDESKSTGFVVDNYPELKKKWTLYTGALVSDFMEKIGGDIDFCFIDTMHVLPGEVIDFLLVLPYLKPNATIVFHDTNLQTWGEWPQCNSNNMLVSAISGEKMVPEAFETFFFHQTKKRDYQMYFPNIAGIELDGSQQNKIWDIFNLLTQKWKYIPKSSDIESILTSLKKHYSKFYVKMFENILSYQMNNAKNEHTIQDIINENQNRIEEKTQIIISFCDDLNKSQLDVINQNSEKLKDEFENKCIHINNKLDDLNNNIEFVEKSMENLQNQFNKEFFNTQNNFSVLRGDMEKKYDDLINNNQKIEENIILNQICNNNFETLLNILKNYDAALQYNHLKKEYCKYKFLRWIFSPKKRKKYKEKYKKAKNA